MTVKEPKQVSTMNDCVSDIYMIRRKIQKELPDEWERMLALSKLDEAAFWIKSIPVDMDSE